MPAPGIIYGVGLGPGDPELMSLRASRLLQKARIIAYFRKKGRPGRARTTVEGYLSTDVTEYPMDYPVTTELPFDQPAYQKVMADFYEEKVDELLALSRTGKDVMVLCEGDPFFYGSFMHLYTRLYGRVEIEVVPGITGMSGGWTEAGQPMTWGDDYLGIAMATTPEEQLYQQIKEADALVIMKIGRHLEKVKRVFDRAGRLERALLIAEATLPGQQIMPLAKAESAQLGSALYFSLVIMPGQGRRP